MTMSNPDIVINCPHEWGNARYFKVPADTEPWSWRWKNT